MAEASQTRNLDFKLLSSNTRGLREFNKLKSIINWTIKQKADIIFFQETCSTPACEREWKSSGKVICFFRMALIIQKVF